MTSLENWVAETFLVAHILTVFTTQKHGRYLDQTHWFWEYMRDKFYDISSVKGELAIVSALNPINSHWLRWLGHVVQTGEDDPVKPVLNAGISWRRRRRRSCPYSKDFNFWCYRLENALGRKILGRLKADVRVVKAIMNHYLNNIHRNIGKQAETLHISNLRFTIRRRVTDQPIQECQALTISLKISHTQTKCMRATKIPRH